MTTKTFDCVEMKRKGAEALMKRLEGMTREQELAFWKAETDALIEFKKERCQASAAPSTPPPGPNGR